MGVWRGVSAPVRARAAMCVLETNHAGGEEREHERFSAHAECVGWMRKDM